MRNQLKRILSITLAMAMGLSSVSVPALAEESEPITEAVVEEVSLDDDTADTTEDTTAVEETTEASSEETIDESAEESSADEDNANSAGTEPAEGDTEETVEEDDENTNPFRADFVLSEKDSSSDAMKKVNITATADDEDETFGYIFFWQYDGTFPDDADAWADYFTTAYTGIEIEGYDSDFGGLYLPVTLADGSEGSVDANFGSVNGTYYLGIEMPAGSSMNTDLEFGVTENHEEDLYVMLEASYADTDKDVLKTTDYLPLMWTADEEESEEELLAFDEEDESEEMTEDKSESEELTEEAESETESEEESESEEDTEEETDKEEGYYQVHISSDDNVGILLDSEDGLYQAGDTVLFYILLYDDEEDAETEVSDAEVEETDTEDAEVEITKTGEAEVKIDEGVGTGLLFNLFVTDEDGNDIDLTFNQEIGAYEFIMPESDATIEASIYDAGIDLLALEGTFSLHRSGTAYVPSALSISGNAATGYRTIHYELKDGTTADGLAYCVQPPNSDPTDMDTDISFSSDDVIEMDTGTRQKTMSKAMYYLYGGPMWGRNVEYDDAGHTINLEQWLIDLNCGFTKDSDMEFYAITHFVLGYIWMDGASGGSNWNGRGSTANVLNDYGVRVVERLVDALLEMPDPRCYLNKDEMYAYDTAENGLFYSETNKYKGTASNPLYITLPDGIYLYHVSEGTTRSPGHTVIVEDDEQFRFLIDPSEAVGKKTEVDGMTMYYTDITFAAKYATDYEAYVFRTGSWEQDMGFGFFTGDNTLTLRLYWPAEGYVQLIKDTANTTIVEGNDMYSLEGAEYTVYDSSGDKVETLVTKADGTTDAVELTIGTYTVKETKAPKGYELDTTEYTVKVTSSNTEDKPATVNAKDTPLVYYFDLLLDKSTDYNTDKSLEGAVFKVQFYAGKTSASGDATRTWYFETKQDNNGKYIIELLDRYLSSDYPNDDLYYDSNGTPCIPLGTLVLTEEKAPEGYTASADVITYVLESDTYSALMNSKEVGSGSADSLKNRTISEGIVNDATVVEVPPFGGVIAYKVDDETAKGEPQGDARLDATFSIYNKNSYSVARKSDPDTAYKTDEKVMEITADPETGIAQSGVELQGDSSYQLKETKAPTGYTSSGSNLSFDFTLPDEDGYIYDASADSEKIRNTVIKGGITLQKFNRELKDAENYSFATLSGATFDIINASDHSALNIDGKEIPTAKSLLSSNPTYSELRVLADDGSYTMQTITTDASGSATTGAKALPYGTYYVIETQSSDDYWIDDLFVGKVVIRDDDVMLNLGETNGESSFIDIYETDSLLTSSVDQPPRRNELRFAKTDIDGEPLAYIPFMIEAYDGNGNLLEEHVIVTDANGVADTSKRSKTDKNVNGMDKYVDGDTITAEGESKLSDAASWGIWFGETSAENDEYGSLYDSYYRIQELKCEANSNDEDNLLHSETFLVKNETGELYEVMIDNSPIFDYHTFVNTVIELTSYAEDKQSGSKTISASNRAEVTDEVTYSHVSAGDTYRMETQFIDITTNNYVPIVGTNDSEEVVNGNWVTKVFVPEKTTSTTNTHGTITMSAILDTTGLEGHTIVAVDYLYQNVEGNWLCVSVHSDLEDTDQYLYVPDIHTSAVDGLTKDREGAELTDTYIVDTVEYTGLGKGIQYVLTMDVVDASTGKSINGNVVQSKVIYSRTTENYSGSVVMPDYPINAEDLEGKTVVVVEKLYLADEDGNPEGDPVIEHDSLLDEDQTIHYMEVETTAKDGKTDDHVGTVEPIATIYDEVKLSNVVFDDNDHEGNTHYKYKVTGSLVYQTDFVDAEGKAHKAGDEVPTLEGTYDAVTIESDANGNITFTYEDGTEAVGTITNMHYGYNTGKTVDPSDEGNNTYVEDHNALIADVTVELIYKIDSSILEGTTVVVFEDVEHNDVTIAKHHDIEDEKQSVHYPKLETMAHDTATDAGVGYVTEDDTIVDTVILTNLIPGESYTVTGSLMNQITGKELEINGKTFEVSAEIYVTEDGVITAPNGEAVTTTYYDEELQQVNGTIDLTFNIDASGLEAMTVVVFEKLYHPNEDTGENVEVDEHEDITDTDQSVYYPMIWSEAWDSETLDHVGTVEGDDVVYDTVFLKNLKIGEQYTVYGVLYDKTSGDPILDVDGSLMTQSCTFIAGETTALSMTEHGSADGHVEDVENDSLEITITELNEEYGYVNCEFVLAIPVDTRDFEGITAVIVETLSYNGLDIANDYDYAWGTDNQSLFYTVLTSSAVDTTTGKKLGAVPGEGESTGIRDEVGADNLVEGMEYVLNAVLVDLQSSDLDNDKFMYLKEDGTLTDNKDEAYTKTITFTAESESESLLVEFTLTTDKIQDMVLMVMTDLYHNDVVVDEHPERYTDGWHQEDLYEEAVVYPADKTNATDNITDEHISDANGTRTIEDRVWFDNLFLDEEYTIEGQLVYQSDFTDANGVEHKAGDPVNGETRSVTFTATADLTEAVQDDGKTAPVDSVTVTTLVTGQDVLSGYVTLTFEVDESALAGATIVVFEDLIIDDADVGPIDLCPHHNLRDLPETIRIPKIGTSAASDGIDENSIYDEDGNFKDIVITDRVTYENLWTQEELELMHEQGLDLIYLDGTYRIKASDDEDGRVIFDINENATYTLKGILMDKETGEPLVDANGDIYEVFSEAFSPSSSDGYVDMEFVLNGADFMVDGECILEGKSVVVFEYLYVADNPEDCTDDRETAFHEDIEDTNQDIRFPKGRTHATDTEDAIDMSGDDYVDAVIQMHEGETTTTAHEVMADGSVSITDMFAFENLHGATVYEITATLQKVTGYDENGVPNAWEPATDDNGDEITVTITLDTSEYSDDYNDSVSGYVPIVFEFEGTNLLGETTVVFENVYRDGQAVLVHADITDEAQTIAFPKIGTKAEDAISGTSEMLAAGKSYILDTVSYENLENGKEYTMHAAMYDKETGLKVEDAEVSGTFVAGAENQVVTPYGTFTMTREEITEFLGGYTTETGWDDLAKGESYATAEMGTSADDPAEEDGGIILDRVDGEVYMLIELDSSWLEGHTLVAYETLYAAEDNGSDKEIAEHKDIEDEDQMVYIPKIGTTATVDNEKTVTGGTITIDDKVEYENLQPGKEYKVRGVVMDKTTGQSLDAYGEETFTPEETDGEVYVQFNVDVSSLAGHTLVVFEELLTEDDDDGYHIVAEHKDIEDEGQSITITDTGVPTEGIPGTPQTGDTFNWAPLVIVLIVVAILILVAVLLRQNKNGQVPPPTGTQASTPVMPESDIVKPQEGELKTPEMKPEEPSPTEVTENVKPEAPKADGNTEDPKTDE